VAAVGRRPSGPVAAKEAYFPFDFGCIVLVFSCVFRIRFHLTETPAGVPRESLLRDCPIEHGLAIWTYSLPRHFRIPCIIPRRISVSPVSSLFFPVHVFFCRFLTPLPLVETVFPPGIIGEFSGPFTWNLAGERALHFKILLFLTDVPSDVSFLRLRRPFQVP